MRARIEDLAPLAFGLILVSIRARSKGKAGRSVRQLLSSSVAFVLFAAGCGPLDFGLDGGTQVPMGRGGGGGSGGGAQSGPDGGAAACGAAPLVATGSFHTSIADIDYT